MLLLSTPPLRAREYTTLVDRFALDSLAPPAVDQDEEEETAALATLLQRPLNVNQAQASRLVDLPGVDEDLAAAIVAHRPFARIGDLLRVEGLDPALLRRVRPFVRLRPWLRMRLEVLGSAGFAPTARRRGSTPGEGVPPAGAGYLSLFAEPTARLRAGLLATYRPLVRAYWDRSAGFLVATSGGRCASRMTACSPHVGDVDGAFLAYRGAEWAGVVGTFSVGFAERLTFDTSGRRRPRGWVEENTVVVSRPTAVIRPAPALRGFALRWRAEAESAVVAATVFASHNGVDLYQYGFSYRGSAAPAERCADGYQGVPPYCRSSRIYDSQRPGRPFRYVQLQDAFTAMVLGGNVDVDFRRGRRVGLTAYFSQLQWNLPAVAQAVFPIEYLGADPTRSIHVTEPPKLQVLGGSTAVSAPPQVVRAIAVGVHGEWRLGDLRAAGEVTVTGARAAATVLRAVVVPAKGQRLEFKFRHFSRDFANPYARSDPGAHETLGTRRRNNTGLGAELRVRLSPSLKLGGRTRIDRRPHTPLLTPDRLLWQATPTNSLRLEPWAEWSPTTADTIGAAIAYDRRWGPGAMTGEAPLNPASGLRRRQRLSLRSSLATVRLPGLNVVLTYRPRLTVDAQACAQAESAEGKKSCPWQWRHGLALRLATARWAAAQVSLTLRADLHPLAGETNAASRQIQGRLRTDVAARTSVAHTFLEGQFRLAVSYGVSGRLGRSGGWRHFAALVLESAW